MYKVKNTKYEDCPKYYIVSRLLDIDTGKEVLNLESTNEVRKYGEKSLAAIYCSNLFEKYKDIYPNCYIEVLEKNIECWEKVFDEEEKKKK